MGKRKTLEKFESGGKKSKIIVQENYFLKLNDDCLDIIFKQLQMKDQLNLAFTCLFLERAFIFRSKVQYKNLHINILQNLPLLSARKFLEMAGPQIQNLFGRVPSKNTEDILEHVKLFCTNINVLTLCDTELDTRSFKGLMQKMPMITDVRLYNLPITDACVRSLKMLPNLKNLTLRGNSKITGKFIKDIVNIEMLSLKDSRRIGVRPFAELCESLTNLKSLDFRGCTNVLRKSVFKDIYKHLKNVETLKVTFEYANDMLYMVRLPKLKHLYVDGRIDSKMLVDMCAYQSNQLETLSIGELWYQHELVVFMEKLKMLKKFIMEPYSFLSNDKYLKQMITSPNLEEVDLSNCHYFTANGLLEMIKGLRKLHTLKVKGCTQLKDSFVKDVLNLVSNERNERQHRRPLIIWAFWSGINLRSISLSELKSGADLVKFKLDDEPRSPDDFDVLCSEADQEHECELARYENMSDSEYDSDSYY